MSSPDAHPNVIAALKSHSVSFTIRRHDAFPRVIDSPRAFAEALGYDLHRITKTLFVKSQTGDCRALVVAPSPSKIDLKAIAARLGSSRVEIASKVELADHLGYPPGSVSPLGVGSLPVFLDESLLAHPTILTGSGQPAVEIELTPADLVRATSAVTFSFAL